MGTSTGTKFKFRCPVNTALHTKLLNKPQGASYHE